MLNKRITHNWLFLQLVNTVLWHIISIAQRPIKEMSISRDSNYYDTIPLTEQSGYGDWLQILLGNDLTQNNSLRVRKNKLMIQLLWVNMAQWMNKCVVQQLASGSGQYEQFWQLMRFIQASTLWVLMICTGIRNFHIHKITGTGESIIQCNL